MNSLSSLQRSLSKASQKTHSQLISANKNNQTKIQQKQLGPAAISTNANIQQKKQHQPTLEWSDSDGVLIILKEHSTLTNKNQSAKKDPFVKISIPNILADALVKEARGNKAALESISTQMLETALLQKLPQANLVVRIKKNIISYFQLLGKSVGIVFSVESQTGIKTEDLENIEISMTWRTVPPTRGIIIPEAKDWGLSIYRPLPPPSPGNNN